MENPKRLATEIQRQDRTIDIRVRAAEGYRDSAADLRNLVVVQREGTSLPLSAVATVEEAEGPAEIRRADGERTALLTANLAGRDLASVTAEIETLIGGLDLPTGFDWQMGGQGKEMQTSFDSMRLALALAVFLVYLVMASQFESLRHPLVILGSVPLALVGVLVILALAQVRISIVVLIGVVLLAGIVVNNAIILVDTTNRLRRVDGLAKVAALAQAGRLRLRPILMTTATTVLGLLPMAIGLGGDLVFRDERVQLTRGDRAWQGLVVVRYDSSKNPGNSIGGYAVYRTQRNIDDGDVYPDDEDLEVGAFEGQEHGTDTPHGEEQDDEAGNAAHHLAGHCLTADERRRRGVRAEVGAEVVQGALEPNYHPHHLHRTRGRAGAAAHEHQRQQ